MAHQPNAYCRNCGARIRWCATDNGKRLPLDAEPELRFVLDPSTDPMIGRQRRTYTCHFDTCARKKPGQQEIETVGNLFEVGLKR